MKDIKGTELKEGDLLLNLRSERDPFDAWRFLIVVKDDFYYVIEGSPILIIRDLNAWNCGWDEKETFCLGNWRDSIYLLDDTEIGQLARTFPE